MAGRVIVLSIALGLGNPTLLSQSTGTTELPGLPPRLSQSLPSSRAAMQRNLIRNCLYTAKFARKRLVKMSRIATHDHPDPGQIQQHVSEVQSSVDTMVEDHERLLYTLSREQWTSAKEPITELEHTRIGIQVQLDGIRLECQMPSPDPKVFARYGKKMEALLDEWRDQCRRLSKAIGIDP